MEFSPEPDDESDLTSNFQKRRLETIESYDETSFEDTNYLEHRDSITQGDCLAQRDSSSYIAGNYQDSTIDTGSSNSDVDDN